MKLNQRLFELFAGHAKEVTVHQMCLGLGYTAVTTSDGGLGIAYTYFDSKQGCSLVGEYVDFENRPAIELLKLIQGQNPLQRSMALALINALNYSRAKAMPKDRGNEIFFSRFDIQAKTRIAMVGFFGPLVKMLEARQAQVEVIDNFRGLGEKDSFYDRLHHWADVLIVTSTAILNNTVEDILGQAGKQTKAVLLGPSTPMAPAAFAHLPVHMLAGMVPVDHDSTLKCVRHGVGTRAFSRHSKKVCWVKA